MLIEGQLIKIKINGHTLKHYNKLGYNVNKGDIIHVPPEHLVEGSHMLVSVICDICGNIIKREYREYLKKHTYNMDCCCKCQYEKTKITNQIRYGVDAPLQNPQILEKTQQTNLVRYGVPVVTQNLDVQKKIKQTCLDKYGVTNPGQSNEVKEKIKQTCIEKFGCENPFANKNIKERIKQTIFDRYGVEHASQSDICKQKVTQTNLEKYGVLWPLQNPTVREKVYKTNMERYGVDIVSKNPTIQAKMRQSLCENGTGKASKQQIKLYEIVKNKYYDAILNYPYSTCSLDIYIEVDNVKIDIEYDSRFWHQNQQRDIRRDKFLQNEGFKTLRIKSNRLLPSEEELFSAIDYLVKTEHCFQEIILSDWKENIKKEGDGDGE